MSKQVYNFCAGPSHMADEVMARAQAELRDFNDLGMSPMEISHRSRAFVGIMEEAEARMRRLADIPDNYRILFMQGGASLQFPLIPMNFQRMGKGAYVITGRWATKAYEAAHLQNRGVAIAGSADRDFEYIPRVTPEMIPPDAGYLHICDNNTLYGTRYYAPPETDGVPLISDMSSCFLSETFDITKYGMIYAGAQKNLGPSGICVVIIREDLIDRHLPDSVPVIFRYATYEAHRSLYNTPPTFQIYMMNLVLEWLEDQGGLEVIGARNRRKAKILYDVLRASSIYVNRVPPRDRSFMNVPFHIRNREWEELFLVTAADQGLVNLRGHRSTGGIRASIYNAMPVAGVQALADFMVDFETSMLEY